MFVTREVYGTTIQEIEGVFFARKTKTVVKFERLIKAFKTNRNFEAIFFAPIKGSFCLIIEICSYRRIWLIIIHF